jgi:hypothetical protein
MRALGAIAAAGVLLSGCVSVTGGSTPTCPTGQDYVRTAQLFFGRNIGDEPKVSEADFRKFVEEEVTPRFPDGLTVLDGGGQWRDKQDRLIREASKVVLVVMPKGRDADARVEAVRTAYKTRFHQESVLLVTQASCVSF